MGGLGSAGVKVQSPDTRVGCGGPSSNTSTAENILLGVGWSLFEISWRKSGRVSGTEGSPARQFHRGSRFFERCNSQWSTGTSKRLANLQIEPTRATGCAPALQARSSACSRPNPYRLATSTALGSPWEPWVGHWTRPSRSPSVRTGCQPGSAPGPFHRGRSPSLAMTARSQPASPWRRGD